MQVNKVIKNASWIIGMNIFQSILSLIISMLTARYLGPANYGLINYASSLANFMMPVMQLGFASILVQEIVENHDEEGTIIGTALGLNVLSGIMCIIGIILFSCIANSGEKETIIVCALYSLSLFARALEGITYWFEANLLSKYTAIVSLIAYTLVSSYKIFLLVTNKSVRWFAVTYALDFLIISLSLLVLYHKLGGKKLHFSFLTGKKMFLKSKYFIISGLMISVFSQTDRVMLKVMLDEAATGYYSAAVACSGMTSFVFAAIINSARPVLFESKIRGQYYFERYIKYLYSTIIYLALAQCIAITLCGKLVIYILYGEAYFQSILPLKIIIWYTPFSYIGPIRNIWMLAEKKHHLIWIVDLSGAIINVCLNLIFIPYGGAAGAAMASLITQIFTNVIMGYILKDIRRNNLLMLEALNPKYLLGLIRQGSKK